MQSAERKLRNLLQAPAYLCEVASDWPTTRFSFALGIVLKRNIVSLIFPVDQLYQVGGWGGGYRVAMVNCSLFPSVLYIKTTSSSASKIDPSCDSSIKKKKLNQSPLFLLVTCLR